MKTLIEILTEETQSLKVQYLQKTEEWVKNQIEWNKKRHAAYFKMTNDKSVPRNHNYFDEQRWVYSSSCFLTLGVLPRFLKDAEKHYESSIVKLADRITVKGLDITKLSVKTSHIGVNIDTVLTDGSKTVRAFTIIAGGAIQRPHYRYLIK